MKHHKANSNVYLIINNGARVVHHKYDCFAKFVCSKNINVITYDYTDVGICKNSLKKSKTSITNWMNLDLKKIVDYITTSDQNAIIFLLGHSLGGQIIGLFEDYHRINGIILVATQTGYWKFWPFPLNIINYLTWSAYIPIVLKIHHFLPKATDQNSADMPKNAAYEWAKWCKSKNYLFEHIPETKQYYDKIICPLFSISFENDIYATKKAVNWITRKYVNTQIHRKHYSSKEMKYGHSAAFEPSNFDLIGNDIVNFITKHT